MAGKAARRYAKAFLSVSLENEKLDTVHDDFRTVRDLLDSHKELAAVLKSPVIRYDVKREAIKSIFSSLDPLSLRFLDFIVEKRRADLLQSIVDGFLEIYKQHIGLLDVRLESAVELDGERIERLTNLLEASLEGTVAIESHIDASLLGGVSVQIEDTIIDGTVRHKLNRLAASFKEAAI